MEAYIKLALELAAAGAEIAPLVKSLYASFTSGNDPTDADWAALYAIRDAQTADIQAPIPGEV